VAVYQPAGDTCSGTVQFLMAQWLIFTSNGMQADADATEVKLNALGASMTGA
jgi:hypothetical protein